MNARSNPFFTASSLPYQAPPFDNITDENYLPALLAGIEEKRLEVQAIANESAPATFANTCVALQRCGSLLTRVNHVFSAMTSANTSAILQQIDETIAPQLTALNDEIMLNSALFARLDAVYQQRNDLALEGEDLRLLEVMWQSFQLAGASLNEQQKQQLKALNQEEAALTTRFTHQLLAATKSGGLLVEREEALAGLTADEIEAAKSAARARGIDDGWLLGLHNTSQQPVNAQLTVRETRAALHQASVLRTEKGDSNDTRSLVQRLAKIRAEQASLLGFRNFAAWQLQDQMAATPEAALGFMRNIVPAARRRAQQEASDIQAVIDAEHAPFALAAWDWNFYAEQVRLARYDLDESQIQPYFALERVLEEGVFWSASQLFGIRFALREDIPVYHPDVRVWEIFDADNTPLALFYGDFWQRDSKLGGAWMGTFVDQSTLLNSKPVIYNVCNYTKPAAGQPCLLNWDEVITLFHEFGHTLHGLFPTQRYATLSGTNTPRDFVEFPSQLNEHWASHPAVFSHYARHWQTGEPMPAALQDKMHRASRFNKGYDMSELLAAALLDQHWHSLDASVEIADVARFEQQALQQEGLDLPQVPPRYRSSYFQHVWGGGYSAGYYAYIWTQMLADDGFDYFVEQGGLTRENGERYRQMILSRGNSSELQQLYRDWRGADPQIGPMLLNRGLAD